MNRGGDVAIDQAKAIVTMCRGRLVGEAEGVQSPVQPVAGPVAGKDSTGSITSVGGWSEADYQELCIHRAQTRHRPPPVFPIAKAPDLIARYRFAVFDESWATPAIDNLTLGRQLGHSESAPKLHLEKTLSRRCLL